MSKKESSRFDALFGAAKDKTDSQAVAPERLDVQTSEHLNVLTSKSKDPNYIRTTVYLPKTLHKKLKAAAADDEREMSDIVAELVQGWLDARK